jgi:excisionase family DNA binding protein
MTEGLLATLVARATPAELAEIAGALAPHLERAATTGGALMTAKEAGEYLRCDRERIYELKRMGAIRTEHDGTKLLFRRRELDRYLREGPPLAR